MFYIIAALIIITLIILFIILSDVTIHIMFRRSPGYQKSRTQIFVFKSLKLLDKKLISKKENYKSQQERVFDKLDKYQEIVSKSLETMTRYNNFLRDINNNLGNGLKTAKLDLSADIGTGDAATTGILCGVAWSILGNLRMQKDYYNLFKNVQFSINPNYKKKIFAIDIDSIFTIKSVYIIYVLILLKEVFRIEDERAKSG